MRRLVIPNVVQARFLRHPNEFVKVPICLTVRLFVRGQVGRSSTDNGISRFLSSHAATAASTSAS